MPLIFSMGLSRLSTAMIASLPFCVRFSLTVKFVIYCGLACARHKVVSIINKEENIFFHNMRYSPASILKIVFLLGREAALNNKFISDYWVMFCRFVVSKLKKNGYDKYSVAKTRKKRQITMRIVRSIIKH